MKVSSILGISPFITFADTVTWNWELIHPGKPVTIDNMRIIHCFSGRDDERHFYQVQTAIELHGVHILQIIESYHQVPISTLDSSASIIRIAQNLDNITEIIEEISGLIQSIRDGCDPYIFYRDMRPWYNGSDAKDPLGPGWIYEGVDPTTPGLRYLSGPSGGQSTVMHVLDLFLGVSHDKPGDRSQESSSENEQKDHGFMERMRMYMLGRHREYLQCLAKSPFSIRDIAQRSPTLRDPYNHAVAALKKLRGLHMRIALMYIVSMSKSASPRAADLPVSAQEIGQEVPIRGTGGTEVAVLLKAGIEATSKATLKS